MKNLPLWTKVACSICIVGVGSYATVLITNKIQNSNHQELDSNLSKDKVRLYAKSLGNQTQTQNTDNKNFQCQITSKTDNNNTDWFVCEVYKLGKNKFNQINIKQITQSSLTPAKQADLSITEHLFQIKFDVQHKDKLSVKNPKLTIKTSSTQNSQTENNFMLFFASYEDKKIFGATSFIVKASQDWDVDLIEKQSNSTNDNNTSYMPKKFNCSFDKNSELQQKCRITTFTNTEAADNKKTYENLSFQAQSHTKKSSSIEQYKHYVIQYSPTTDITLDHNNPKTITVTEIKDTNPTTINLNEDENNKAKTMSFTNLVQAINAWDYILII